MTDESVRVFDDVKRVDDRPAGYNEPTSTFLNRAAGEAWQRVRELVEDWYEHLAANARIDLRARLRSTSEIDFRSAFFELYCHELLRRGGWEVETHPHLGHTSRLPDLRAQRGATMFYLEATTSSPPKLDEAAEARMNTVMDYINERLDVDEFMLGIDVLSVGTGAPATGPLCNGLRLWMQGLDADALLQGGQDGEFERFEWITEGWSLTFEAYPLARDRRGPGGRIIGTSAPGEANIIDDVKPLRRRIGEKAKAYGDLGEAFVVAIDVVSSFASNGDFVSAFYGTSAVGYYESGGPEAPPPVPIRLSDGLLAGPEGWRRRQLSAVLATTMLTPWSVASTVPTLWVHPGARQPLASPAQVVRQARLNHIRHEIEYVEPIVAPHEFFELPGGWPGFDSRG